ncbi:MAG TPA: DUF3352 domain-containing protein [Phototrophicaceae bacterium]|nr:DUF3352 domain-containing protein [Phototrophicaceae bacterium]
MRKVILLAALSVLILGALVLPAAAQQQADLSALAKYFPADSAAYIGFRTDDATINAVNDLINRIQSIVPGTAAPDAFKTGLDTIASMEAPGATFADTIRPWAGDSGALGVATLVSGGSQTAIFVLSVTDEAKANTFFNTLLTKENYTSQSADGATVYTDPTNVTHSTYIVHDDAVVITNDPAAIADNGVPTGSTLADDADFKAALALLPAQDYAGIGYANTPAILTAAIQDRASTMSRANAAGMQMVSSALATLKPEAFGLTMLDQNTLAFDAALPYDPNSSSPFAMNMSGQPLDPAFVQHIPANTPFVVEGTDLYDNYEAAVKNLQTLAQSMPQTNSRNGMSVKNLQTALWGMGFLVRGLTGEEVGDAFGWMTGDYALSLGFSPSFSDATSMLNATESNPVDFGITLAATDAAAAQKVYDGLKRSLLDLPAENVTVKEDTLDGGTPALVFTVQSPDMPFPLEILAATGNGVFAVGTRRMVTAAINPTSGLDTDTTYSTASAYLLKNANTVLFLSGPALQPLVRVMSGMTNPESVQQQGQQLGLLLKLLDSASISVANLPNNGGRLARLVWTLPQ